VRVKKGMGSFPLTSILSLGGERKIREWCFLRGDGGGFDTIIFIQFITRY
jgi:hypothetical protein